MEKETTIPQMVEQVRSGKLPRRRLAKILAGMGISAAGIGAVMATTADAPAVHHSTAVNVKEDPNKHLEMHNYHISAQAQGNKGALHQDYAENAVVEDPLFAQPLVGRVAIMARKNMGFAAVTTPEITIKNRVAFGNQVAAEWVATGVHTGDLPGLSATGRPYTLSGMTVVIREEGKIVRESLYYDVEDLYRQLRQG